jgi:trehalose 6-phosphate phosphatase
MTLPEPTTPEGRAGLAAVVAEPSTTVLALDFDGTLAPIVEDPTLSRAHPAVVPALARLGRRLASIALITGRPAEVAARYAGLDAAPHLGGVAVLGLYGAERWDPATGQVLAPPVDPGVEAARRDLVGVLAELGVADEVLVEDKGRSVAVHTRRASRPAALLGALAAPLASLAGRHGLVVEPGRLVLELRPPGMDKGRALDALVAETGAGAVVFAGDDLGDLPAFEAVDRLRARGLSGLKVASGSTEVAGLAERADLVVDGPEGVARFLAALADRLERGPGSSLGGGHRPMRPPDPPFGPGGNWQRRRPNPAPTAASSGDQAGPGGNWQRRRPNPAPTAASSGTRLAASRPNSRPCPASGR